MIAAERNIIMNKHFLFFLLIMALTSRASWSQQQYQPGKLVIQPIQPVAQEVLPFTQEEIDFVFRWRDSRSIDTNFDGSMLVESQKTYLLNSERNAINKVVDGNTPTTVIEQLNLSYMGDKLAYITEDSKYNYVYIINPLTKDTIVTYSEKKEIVVDKIVHLEANADLTRLVYTYSYGPSYNRLVVLNNEGGMIKKVFEIKQNSDEESLYESLDNIVVSDSGNHIFYTASFPTTVMKEGKPINVYETGMYELTYDNNTWVGPTKIFVDGFSTLKPLGVAKDGDMLLFRAFQKGVHILKRTSEGWSEPVLITENSSGFNQYVISADGLVIAAAQARPPLPPLGSDAPLYFDINLYFFDENKPNLYRKHSLTNTDVYSFGHLLLSRDGTRLFWKPEVKSSIHLFGN